ncbi:MAG: methyltransferase domain-containing protein [Ignavibacteriae bacterium]|nr:MAG: methyltransferase domain-containing protein [Ignavibacteriota bacterium]
MSKRNQRRAEFYGAAEAKGYYGLDKTGIFGKKDNVRKFWEDISIKLLIRPYIENLMSVNQKIRILDMGSGSGEGFDLLTHIPSNSKSIYNEYVLLPPQIDEYVGIDINLDAIEQGKNNFKDFKGVSFEYGDLEEGIDKRLLQKNAFDVYISTYGSLSFLNPDDFKQLACQVFSHAKNGSLFIFDVHGKYCPAWPVYWNEKLSMQPYTMSYLNPSREAPQSDTEYFNICYWTVKDLKFYLERAAELANVKINILSFTDRSIFVGRHIDTGMFSTKALPIRFLINRMLDHDYTGGVESLKLDLSHLDQYRDINPEAWERITDYQRQWNRVLILLEALRHQDDTRVKNFLENTDIELMSEELKFITWLYRNSDRFPVVDFWSNVIGPQIAVILRNIEMSYIEGVGCGHGLVGMIEIIK